MQFDFIENYSRPVWHNKKGVKGYGRYQEPLLDFSHAFDQNGHQLLGDSVLWLCSDDSSILNN